MSRRTGISLKCNCCAAAAKYHVLYATGQTVESMALCGSHSKKTWKDWKPLANSAIKTWHQELIVGVAA